MGSAEKQAKYELREDEPSPQILLRTQDPGAGSGTETDLQVCTRHHEGVQLQLYAKQRHCDNVGFELRINSELKCFRKALGTGTDMYSTHPPPPRPPLSLAPFVDECCNSMRIENDIFPARLFINRCATWLSTSKGAIFVEN